MRVFCVDLAALVVGQRDGSSQICKTLRRAGLTRLAVWLLLPVAMLVEPGWAQTASKPSATAQNASSGITANTAAKTAPKPGAWITTWAQMLQKQPEPSTVVNKQTIRQRIQVSAGGSQVRVRISNEWGVKPIKIGAATLRLVTNNVPDAAVKTLTFGGSPTVIIPAGAPMISDPIEVNIPHLAQLDLSVYFPEPAASGGYHRTKDPNGMVQTVMVNDAFLSEGNQVMNAAPANETQITPIFFGSVDVYGAPKTPVLVIFGDTRSVDWPTLYSKEMGGKVAVVNQSGYAGSLNLGQPGETGLPTWSSGIARFDRDVLPITGATHVLIFLGDNDISLPGMREKGFVLVDDSHIQTADQIINSLRQLVDRAHAKGLRVIGSTLQIYPGGDKDYIGRVTPDKLDRRDAVNHWIRNSGAFDKVIDFDLIVRNPNDPRQAPAGYDPNNYKHAPTEDGIEIMAKAAVAVLKDEFK